MKTNITDSKSHRGEKSVILVIGGYLKMFIVQMKENVLNLLKNVEEEIKNYERKILFH